jgi:mono/diheme cytochrome c family protein
MVRIVQLKRLAIALVAMPLLALTGMHSAPAQTPSDDLAATYKAKCFACHGAKAEKKFVATKPEDQLVEAILKGLKAEKPPNMPAYESKGISADQAKALVDYMKSLKQ